MIERKATAIAGANIAFIKYWGQLNADLCLPLNNSISMTLDQAQTVTTVEFSEALLADTFTLNGDPTSESASRRVSRHLDRIRELANVRMSAKVVSQNSFPAASGIASSASGFAALTVAACAALGLSLSSRELSRLARLASGSACRSIFGGFVEWIAGTTHEDSYAQQIAPAEYWDLADIISVISGDPKPISSEMGHALAPTSPFLAARLAALDTSLVRVRAAVAQRDLRMLGEVAEQDALSLHAVSMTSHPSILYLKPGTIAVMHHVRQWRQEGLLVYFTIDAGPNIHILTLGDLRGEVLRRVQEIPEIEKTITCRPGKDAHVSQSHLF